MALTALSVVNQMEPAPETHRRDGHKVLTIGCTFCT
jgi:hypothetical protein